MLPLKTQISLGTHPVWSGSSLSAWRKLESIVTHWAHSEDSDQTGQMPRRRLWSDWVDAQADLSLRWAHMPFFWFCHVAAQSVCHSVYILLDALLYGKTTLLIFWDNNSNFSGVQFFFGLLQNLTYKEASTDGPLKINKNTMQYTKHPQPQSTLMQLTAVNNVRVCFSSTWSSIVIK